jgi:O-antigen ligase
MMRAPALRWRGMGTPSPQLSPAAVAVAVGAIILALAGIVLLERGGPLGFALLALLAFGVGALLFADYAYEVFVGWVLLEGIAFPFIRYPHYSTPFFTFDRYVLIALAGALLLQRRRTPMSKHTRHLTIAMGVFTLAYGFRAITTDQLLLPTGMKPTSSLQPEADWLDGVLLPFIVFLAAARTITPSRWPTVAKALTFTGATIGGLAILEWIFGFELATITGLDPFQDGAAGVVRAGGPYPTPSALGSVMIVCMVGTLYWLQTERAYAIAGSAFAIEILGLLPGLTKTVWAAAFVVLLVGFGVRNRVSSRTALVGIYAATTVGVAYFFVKSSPVVAARVTSTAAEDSFLGRLATWKQAFLMFERSPLDGVGVEQFIGGQLLVPRPTVGGILPVPSAHNTLLGMMAETGLLATIPLIAMVYASVRVIRACNKLATTHRDSVFRAVLLGGMVGSVLLSMTFNEIYEPPAFMFVALLLGVAAARVDHMTRARTARPPSRQSGAETLA